MTHPSHAFHESIDQKLQAADGDSSLLSEKELHFFRAYEFDSYLQSEGLEGYFWSVDKRSYWTESVVALRAVGATAWAEVFANLLEQDGDAIEAALSDNDWEEGELPFSKDYDALLLALRDGTDEERRMLWMEGLLDRFVSVQESGSVTCGLSLHHKRGVL